MVVARTGDFVMMLQHPRTCYLFFSLHLGLFPKLYKTTTLKKPTYRRQSKTGNIGPKKHFSGLVCYITLLYSSQLASSVCPKSFNEIFSYLVIFASQLPTCLLAYPTPACLCLYLHTCYGNSSNSSTTHPLSQT